MIQISKKTKDDAIKIVVGTDEFCSNCMEWREYDENGKCKVCGRSIIKKSTSHKERVSYDEYGTDNGFDESENEIDDL